MSGPGYDVYVTFSGKSKTPIQHVRSFSASGKDQGAVTPDYDELRGIALDGSGRLYLAVANKNVSAIELFAATIEKDGTRELIGTILTPPTSAVHPHPYGLTFDRNGVLYVSTQDTNCVTGYAIGTQSPPQVSPIPVASALTASFPNGSFYAGQFVAAVEPITHGSVTPPSVPANLGGLSASVVGASRHSVRGVLATPNALYVADEANDRIGIYDLTSGAYKRAITGTGRSSPRHVVDGPVGLAYDAKRGNLYIGSSKNACIFVYAEKSRTLSRLACDETKLAKVSGLACAPDGTLFAASRASAAIFTVDTSSGKIAPFVDGLADAPECLLVVPG
jgi:hypothetical protein